MHSRKEIVILLIGFFILSSVSAFLITYNKGLGFIIDVFHQELESASIQKSSVINKDRESFELSSEICIAKQGRIVNTISETCQAGEKNIGSVKNLRCPCVCCVSDDNMNDDEKDNIDNFEKCIAAGYPATETHPRYCFTADGKKFVETIKNFNEGESIIKQQYCQKDEECDLGALDLSKEECDYQAKCIDNKCEAVCSVKALDRLGNCQNLCGDGFCQEIACLGYSCPCPETKESCPLDCR